MKESVVNKFIDDLVEVLKGENKNREYNRKAGLDIPYIIAPLEQSLSNEKYQEFINDIQSNEYSINYFDDISDGYTNGHIEVNLQTEHKDGCIQCQMYESYSYKIEFGKNDRYWGYCECTPDDKDYREDKDCCGHGCDWTAPTVSVEKVISLGNNGWNGDEHDYWDFEDDFYKSNDELAKGKEEQERLDRIEYIETTISELQNELSKLK